MARPYSSARDHLDDALGLVGQLFERQINAHWEAGILPRIKDQFSGTFVSGGEVAAILGDGAAGTDEGTRRITDLDAAITAREELIEGRLVASREGGTAMPFDLLRRSFGLTPTEQRALWVLIAVELDARMRQLMRYLANEASRVHADVGLLGLLVYSAPTTRDLLVTELAPDSRLARHRLIEPVGSRRNQEDAPFIARPIKVNGRLIELVHGHLRLDPEVSGCAELVRDPPSSEHMLGTGTLRTQVLELVRAGLQGSPAASLAPAVVVSGAEGAGRKTLVLGAAHELDCAVLRVHCDRLPQGADDLARTARALIREAVLFRAVPLFENIEALASDTEAGRLVDRTAGIDLALSHFRGPVAATCVKRDSRPVSLSRGIVMVDVPTPGEAARAELWQRALGAAAPNLDFDRAAARYPVTGGLIQRASESALARAGARGEEVNEQDVHAGLRSTLDVKLSTLGVRITWRQTWDDLVLPDDSVQEIKEFIARVRHRRRVYEEWGFSRKLAKGLGLSALFAGPPGTGKTMVAGIIADELALDLYQIDLSRIVSKYVGETEKNLAKVFDAAEAGHAILLFDEADSLFSKRTEVKSSVDRYANLEVNYLLQRMEQFNGITILTTNLDSSIDDAFRRRISFRVDFPFPEAEERVLLWQAMLPHEAEVGDDIDFEMLGDRYEFSGGYIRNAVLRAAFLAADDDSPITMGHLRRAATLEYAAMGKVVSSLS